jgi:hypothetical protein
MRVKHEKFVAYFIFFIAFGMLPLVFIQHFVATETTSYTAPAVSFSLTAVSLAVLRNLYKLKLYEPNLAWYHYSRFKKQMVLLALFTMIFSSFWISTAITLPYLYTLAFGKPDVVYDKVVKNRSFGSKTCDYQLKPRSIDALFFTYCIPKRHYDPLPDHELQAKLVTSRTVFGYIVTHISLQEDRHD